MSSNKVVGGFTSVKGALDSNPYTANLGIIPYSTTISPEYFSYLA